LRIDEGKPKPLMGFAIEEERKRSPLKMAKLGGVNIPNEFV